MAKNQINFSKMSNEATTQLHTFKDCAIAIAQEDLRHKSVIKPLKAQLETILANRENDVAQGLSVNEVVEKYSRVALQRLKRRSVSSYRISKRFHARIRRILLRTIPT